MLVGGWHENTSESLKEETKPVIMEHLANERGWQNFNIDISHVSSQVVAGLNVAVEFTVSGLDETIKMRAQLFRSLEGQYQITSISEV